MDNKRCDKRWDCVVPVESGRNTAFDGAQSIDFSRQGMGFVTHTPVDVNREIAVALDLDESNSPVLVKGRVLWVQSIAGTDQFRVGLVFEKTLDDGESRLNEYFED